MAMFSILNPTFHSWSSLHVRILHKYLILNTQNMNIYLQVLEPESYNCLPRTCLFERIPENFSLPCSHKLSQVDDIERENNSLYFNKCVLGETEQKCDMKVIY